MAKLRYFMTCSELVFVLLVEVFSLIMSAACQLAFYPARHRMNSSSTPDSHPELGTGLLSVSTHQNETGGLVQQVFLFTYILCISLYICLTKVVSDVRRCLRDTLLPRQ